MQQKGSSLLTVVLGALGIHVGLHARPMVLHAWQADGDIFPMLSGQNNGKDMGTTNTYFHIGQHQFEGLPSRASGRPRPCTAATERAV